MGLERWTTGQRQPEYSADGGATWHASMEAAQAHARLDDFERWIGAPASDTRTFEEWVADGRRPTGLPRAPIGGTGESPLPVKPPPPPAPPPKRFARCTDSTGPR